MSDALDAGYAFWTHPEGRFRIEYSLAVFHEIDFSVGEAFRSIPHGGMETGGLLFGSKTEGATRIDAFRAITCEHVFGPSFVLSDRDLQVLGEQIANAKSDPDLDGMEPLGWFIAHTRSDLAVNDREMQWFDRFFPEPGKFTVLVKPERFQPTRFAFLMREKDGSAELDGRSRAIILPLPGRASGSAGGPVPSVAAPSALPPASRPVPEKHPEPPPEKLPEAPVRPKVTVSKHPEPVSKPPVSKLPEPVSPPPPVEHRAAAPVRSPQHRPPAVAEMLAQSDYAPRRRRLDEPERRIPVGVRLFFVLLLAAALGCAAGYWAYLQLPSAWIPLRVNPEGSRLVITWPPEQTRSVSYAAIRVNDGAPAPLSAGDKAAGRTTIAYSGSDVKVELIVQHWMRQSRGIVRFVTAAGP